jgi:hypothetical protein
MSEKLIDAPPLTAELVGTDEGRFCGGGNCGEFGVRLATSERSGNNPLLSIQLSIDPDIIRHREG